MPINLISQIVPQGQFALMDDNYIRGGFRICATLTDRNAIITDCRKQGMRVFVISTDIVYILQADLVSWTVDATTSSNLQAAFNAGAQIVTTTGNPVLLQGIDSTTIFEIQDSNGNPIFNVNGDGDVNVENTLTGNIFTTSIECVAQTNSSNVIIDSVDITKYRAVQYVYACSNSDNSGFETGRIYLIQNNFQVSVSATMDSSIGIPCGISFGSSIATNEMQLIVTTDNSGAFSRVLRLFKIALP